MALPNFVTCILATGLCGVMVGAMLEKLVPVVAIFQIRLPRLGSLLDTCRAKLLRTSVRHVLAQHGAQCGLRFLE